MESGGYVASSPKFIVVVAAHPFAATFAALGVKLAMNRTVTWVNCIMAPEQ